MSRVFDALWMLAALFSILIPQRLIFSQVNQIDMFACIISEKTTCLCLLFETNPATGSVAWLAEVASNPQRLFPARPKNLVNCSWETNEELVVTANHGRSITQGLQFLLDYQMWVGWAFRSILCTAGTSHFRIWHLPIPRDRSRHYTFRFSVLQTTIRWPMILLKP